MLCVNGTPSPRNLLCSDGGNDSYMNSIKLRETRSPLRVKRTRINLLPQASPRSARRTENSSDANVASVLKPQDAKMDGLLYQPSSRAGLNEEVMSDYYPQVSESLAELNMEETKTNRNGWNPLSMCAYRRTTPRAAGPGFESAYADQSPTHQVKPFQMLNEEDRSTGNVVYGPDKSGGRGMMSGCMRPPRLSSTGNYAQPDKSPLPPVAYGPGMRSAVNDFGSTEDRTTKTSAERFPSMSESTSLPRSGVQIVMTHEPAYKEDPVYIIGEPMKEKTPSPVGCF